MSATHTESEGRETHREDARERHTHIQRYTERERQPEPDRERETDREREKNTTVCLLPPAIRENSCPKIEAIFYATTRRFLMAITPTGSYGASSDQVNSI